MSYKHCIASIVLFQHPYCCNLQKHTISHAEQGLKLHVPCAPSFFQRPVIRIRMCAHFRVNSGFSYHITVTQGEQVTFKRRDQQTENHPLSQIYTSAGTLCRAYDVACVAGIYVCAGPLCLNYCVVVLCSWHCVSYVVNRNRRANMETSFLPGSSLLGVVGYFH